MRGVGLALHDVIAPSAAEDALGPDQQDDDEHEEADGLLVVGLHEPVRRPLLDEAEGESAEERAVGVADAAEHHRGEDREQQEEAHVRGEGG